MLQKCLTTTSGKSSRTAIERTGNGVKDRQHSGGYHKGAGIWRVAYYADTGSTAFHYHHYLWFIPDLYSIFQILKTACDRTPRLDCIFHHGWQPYGIAYGGILQQIFPVGGS